MTGARWLAVAAVLLGLGGCASEREGVLIPLGAPTPGAAQVDMLVATTRAPSEQPGVVFSGERGTGLSLTNVVVSIPPDRQVGTIQWPRSAQPDPTREFAVTSLRELDRAQVNPWFRKTAQGRSRRVLVFVHGFNTRFDSAVFRFAQFVHDSGNDLVPVLFSWPSRGRVLDYNYDRESTNFSRSDLAAVLTAAAKSPDVEEVVVLAHSMGAWLTVEALRQMALTNGRVPPKIKNLILASPDLDIDVFERQMVELGPDRPHVTIFVSPTDKALSLSRLIAGQVTRVGAVDLTDPQYARRLEGRKGIVVLDLSKVESGDPLNHSAFTTSPQIVQLLGERMMAGQVIDDENVPGAAQPVRAVGAAVGTAVAAPILVFTGATAR